MTTRKIVLTGLFVAIGIVLPQAIHLFGGPNLGSILLPIHLPVFIGAMLLGPVSGLIIAVVSVIVGVSIGMPPLIIAAYMIFELSVYAVVSGLLYYKKHLNIYASFVIAKIFGMTVAILIVQMMIHWFGVTYPPVLGTIGMFAIGIPGIIVQILVVPLTVILVQKNTGVANEELS